MSSNGSGYMIIDDTRIKIKHEYFFKYFYLLFYLVWLTHFLGHHLRSPFSALID
jgi:hypothetical protein